MSSLRNDGLATAFSWNNEQKIVAYTPAPSPIEQSNAQNLTFSDQRSHYWHVLGAVLDDVFVKRTAMAANGQTDLGANTGNLKEQYNNIKSSTEEVSGKAVSWFLASIDYVRYKTSEWDYVKFLVQADV